MNQQQTGFTLIELVVVIVILGILSAVALPRFIDLTGEANLAATQGVAGALASATAINYGARKVTPNKAGTNPVDNCGNVTLNTSAAFLLQGNNLPTGYTIASTSGATCTGGQDGGVMTCAVTKTGTTPPVVASAQIICSN